MVKLLKKSCSKGQSSSEKEEKNPDYYAIAILLADADDFIFFCSCSVLLESEGNNNYWLAWLGVSFYEHGHERNKLGSGQFTWRAASLVEFLTQIQLDRCGCELEVWKTIANANLHPNLKE